MHTTVTAIKLHCSGHWCVQTAANHLASHPSPFCRAGDTLASLSIVWCQLPAIKCSHYKVEHHRPLIINPNRGSGEGQLDQKGKSWWRYKKRKPWVDWESYQCSNVQLFQNYVKYTYLFSGFPPLKESSLFSLHLAGHSCSPVQPISIGLSNYNSCVQS